MTFLTMMPHNAIPSINSSSNQPSQYPQWSKLITWGYHDMIKFVLLIINAQISLSYISTFLIKKQRINDTTQRYFKFSMVIYSITWFTNKKVATFWHASCAAFLVFRLRFSQHEAMVEHWVPMGCEKQRTHTKRQTSILNEVISNWKEILHSIIKIHTN